MACRSRIGRDVRQTDLKMADSVSCARRRIESTKFPMIHRALLGVEMENRFLLRIERLQAQSVAAFGNRCCNNGGKERGFARLFLRGNRGDVARRRARGPGDGDKDRLVRWWLVWVKPETHDALVNRDGTWRGFHSKILGCRGAGLGGFWFVSI